MPHFRQSKAARGLSKIDFFEMTEDEAYQEFKRYRWPASNGEPTCPDAKCGIAAAYVLKTRPGLYKCKMCLRQFSATSGTLFAHRKLSYKKLLLAICEFSMDARGDTALRAMASLNITYGSAFVMLHKLREAMGYEQEGVVLRGKVEVDGMAFGHYKRPPNAKFAGGVKQDNRRPAPQCLIVMRERKTNRVLTFAVRTESEGLELIKKHIHRSATVITDDASHWRADIAKDFKRHWRVNHSKNYAVVGSTWMNTNTAESFNNEMRAKSRRHTRISGAHLGRYAAEMAWRIGKRKSSTTERFKALATAAASAPVSKEWKGMRNRIAAPKEDAVAAAATSAVKTKRRRYTY